jgi:hypothetical protein
MQTSRTSGRNEADTKKSKEAHLLIYNLTAQLQNETPRESTAFTYV